MAFDCSLAWSKLVCTGEANFEHSIANLYRFPVGMILGAAGAPEDLGSNILWVTGGNLIFGAIVVPALLWLATRADHDEANLADASA